MSEKTLLSIVTPCYNEEENVEELYRRVKNAIAGVTKYEFELIFIDNDSIDKTQQILTELAVHDRAVKLIFNTRNFGHVRSPYHGILQSSGEATIYLASDLQDPPEIIPEMIKYWEFGYKLVMASKPMSKTNRITHYLRGLYYKLLNKISEHEVIPDATGFGLYDKVVLEQVRKINDPYPFLRGIICDLGWPIKVINFDQPRRSSGISKNNFYTLYDFAMLGFVSQSRLPLRMASFLGFILGAVSITWGFIYFVFKLIYWDDFVLGIAPLLIGFFLMMGILFLLLGVIGEYILSIHGYLKNRPPVVEKKRINFEYK